MTPSTDAVGATPVPRPPIPSIAGSALLEYRLLVARTRRVLGAWMAGATGS